MLKLQTRVIRQCLVMVCIALFMNGCGLSGRHGSLATGVQYEANGQYRAAYIEAKKVLQRNSKNGAAWLLLAEASLRLGNPQDALSDLQHAQANGVPAAQCAIAQGRALLVTQQYANLLNTLSPDKITDPDIKGRVEVLRGDAYLAMKHPDAARQSYQAALALDAKNPLALVGLAKLAAGANDLVAANNDIQQALAIAPENAQAWIFKGDLAFNDQDFASAESDYEKVLSFKNPDWLPQERFYAFARLADAQIQQNRFVQALDNIAMLEKMAPEQPYPHYLHAVVFYKQGHLNEAISQLQQVLKVTPNNELAQLLMGAVNYAQGNSGQAEMYLSNVLGMDPQNADARKLLALTLYHEGRTQQAIETLRQAIPGEQSDAALLVLLQHEAAAGVGIPGAMSSEEVEGHPLNAQFTRVGEALAAGNESEAIHLLQEIPTGNASTEAQRNSLLVMAYVRENRPDLAVKIAAAYAAKSPRESSAHLLYGTALVAAGQPHDAHAQYLEAYDLDSTNLAVLLSLGSLDSLEGHYPQAANRFKQVLEKDHSNAVALNGLGRIAALQGHNAKAINLFKQAIADAPKYDPPYIGLAILYGENGQSDEAIRTAEQLVSVDPNNPAALNALGAVELNAGHPREALKPLQHAVNLSPQEPLYRINLARAQILNKDSREAAVNLEQVIKSNPNQVPAVALLAFLKLQDKDLQGAIALAKTLQKQPATAAAGFTLEGDLYMANKSYHEAAQAYQQGLKISYNRPLVLKTFSAMNSNGVQDADAVLRAWLKKHPDDAATRLLLAQYYLDNSQNILAASQYELVLNAYPTNIDALNNLAWIYTEQHNLKALDLAAKAYKLAPALPDIKDTYAWALIMNNQAKTALPLLMQAAQQAPQVSTIQYHLAVAQADTGDDADARLTLEHLLKSGTKFTDKLAAQKLYRKLNGVTRSNTKPGSLGTR